MEDTKFWTKFEKTGCIADYLSYKGVIKQEGNISQTGNREAGEKTFESVNCSYRDDTVRSTNR